MQRIAIGINILDDKGEEGIIKSIVQLYNIEKSKFVKLYEKELSKGIITMLYSIEGSLIIGEGSRINIYEYSPLNEIKILSYIENKNISVCSKAKHKFIITGDFVQSVTWIHFRQDSSHRDRPYMYLKGIDYSDYASSAIEFWNDESEENAKSGCLISDRNKNLHIFIMESDQQKNYFSGMNQNNITSSLSSSKMTEYADINLGKIITEIKYFNDCEEKKRGVNFYSADDGSIGYVKPISKDSYNCLFMVCEFIYNHVPFKAGLNPKLFFSCKYLNKKDKTNILDMSVLRIYLDLPLTTQKIIAKNVTLKRENLIQLINQINDF